MTFLLTLNSAASLLAISFSLLGIVPQAVSCMPTFNMGDTLQWSLAGIKSITIQTLCHSVITLIQLMLTATSLFEVVLGVVRV